jgi:ATP-dependent Clp protease protease subunit
MNLIKADVSTICLGEAASMGSFLLSAGAKGKRLALPSARIMIHQPLGGAQGQATDIEIEAKEILRMKKELTTILANNSGQDVEKVQKDCERDYYMSAAEAVEYGLIDKVITSEDLK